MNRQQIFSKVKKHLFEQGKAAATHTELKIFGPSMACHYRADDGCKCAVGCLIEDSEYTEDIEGKRVNSTEVLKALMNSGIDVTDGLTLSLLQALQGAHDSCANFPDAFVSKMTEQFESIASDYRLENV